MPAITNITISDGAATPVAHTFSPIGKDDKGVIWLEQTTPAPLSPIGAYRIGYRQSKSLNVTGQGGVSKLVMTLALPKLETLGNNSAGYTPAPTIAYRNVARLEIDMPERSTGQERKDLRIFFANLLNNAFMQISMDNLQPSY